MDARFFVGGFPALTCQDEVRLPELRPTTA